ncbi:PINK1 family protein [Megaselia abdita]
MSVRLLANRIVKHGRYFSQCNKVQILTKIIETTKPSRLPRSIPRVTVAQGVRKSFFDNVLTSSAYVSELRKKAIKTVFGRGGQLFAFVGVGVAGNGFLSKEDELEGVCGEIREVASKIQSSWNYEEITKCLHREITLDDLEIGPSVGKGCSAVVYSAALKSDYFEEEPMEVEGSEKVPSIHNIGRFIHSSGGSSSTFPVEVVHKKTEETKEDDTNKAQEDNTKEYPLALKMMFNYDIQSNAMSIIRAMSKETIPARSREVAGNGQLIEILRKEVLPLPTHPNIVCMFGFFCAPVGDFHDGALLYPSAQPPRINPQGYGRNMSLYLVMKRYDTSLKELVKEEGSLTARNRMLLFTQLLEAIVHLNRYGIAHRDLKADNILIDFHENDSCPELVLTDFGCALANKTYGLRIPYLTVDTDRGGNAALMAPEIINKEPGRFAVLDYTKADLWASGAIAYQIFGLTNPFYADETDSALKNYDYNVEDLPELDEKCPPLVKELILNILNPNPAQRVRSEIAANIMQLFLWAPSKWLKSREIGQPSSHEVSVFVVFSFSLFI